MAIDRFTAVLVTAGLMIGVPFAGTAKADACDEVADWHRAGPVAIGNVEIQRGPLDFEGPRLAGCLRNTGDGELAQVMIEFDNITDGSSSGGFSRNLRLEGLAPGDSTAFVTDQLTRDRERYERFNTTGHRFSGVNVLIAGESGRPEFDAEDEFELPRILKDRPEHELEADCAATDPADGEGDIWINAARLEAVGMPGSVNMVGCVTNRSDETVADGMRNSITVTYEGHAGDEPERMSMVGGQGRLTLAGPLEPGQSSLFVSSFDFEQDIIEIEVYPSAHDYSGDTVELLELGPRVSLEK